jgi:4-hydroxy-4-methyl-2-oxoglutarate aldolase
LTVRAPRATLAAAPLGESAVSPLPPREEIVAKLYAAVLSDVLDGLGLTAQAMRPFVRPLDESLVLFGRARTGLYMPRYHVEPGRNPYEVEIALVDDLREGDVAVLACGGPTDRIAPWGELLTTASLARGAAGCVTDGLVRDVRRVREAGFPVFHGGIGPLDSKGRGEMMAMDVPVECGGVRVEPGDYVLGDADGVVVVPQGVAAEAFGQALAKVEAEDRTREMLAAGRKLKEVFDELGVL